MADFQVSPIRLSAANDFIFRLHRHHKEVQGHKFSLAAWKNGKIVAVVIVGRPVARKTDDGIRLEVTRLCSDGTRNACSFLYGLARRVCSIMGYAALQTFIMETEPGSSLRASDWEIIGETGGKSWSVKTRQRTDKHALGKRRKYCVGL